MTEMRMQPNSSPRSTGIARTKINQHGKSGIGEHHVSQSSGAAPRGQLAAATPQAKPRSATDKGPIPGLSNEQIMLIGGTIESYRSSIVSSAHAVTLAEGAQPPSADTAVEVQLSEMDQAQVDLAMSILDLLGGELDARTAQVNGAAAAPSNGGNNNGGGKMSAGQTNDSGVGQGRTKIRPATGQTIKR